MLDDDKCDNCRFYEPIIHNGNNEVACLRWRACKGVNIVRHGIRFSMCIKQGWRKLKYLDKQKEN